MPLPLTQPEAFERRLKDRRAGCYLMRTRTDLYVGKSKSLRSRVRSYFRTV